MAKKEIALELAAFLDSEQARALEGPSPEQVRRVAEAFLGVCYDELGSKPRLLDGHDVHEALGHRLPGRVKKADPLAEHVPAVLGALFEHLETAQGLPNAFEVRRALDGTMDEFLETVRTGHNAHHHVRQEPVVHRAPKLGRNDPCPCGSGKKYKKCHGKDA